jgi:hypothetical protein
MNRFLLHKLLIGVSVFAITFLQVVKSNAQFLNKDAAWNVFYMGMEGMPDRYTNLKIEKDSLINDTVYSIFNRHYDRYALREDSDKVFFRVLPPYIFQGSDSSEHLLYDFGLELNDSIILNLLGNEFYTTKKWKVTDIDSVLVGNKYKKRILLKVDESAVYPMEGVQYWIEDVGSSEGPIYMTGISEFETVIHLSCYWVNGELLFSTEFSKGKCNFLDADPGYPIYKDVISYNTSLHQVKINLPLSESCFLSVYRINGQKVFNKKVPCNSYVKLMPINTGIYIFEVTAGNLIQREKVIIY